MFHKIKDWLDHNSYMKTGLKYAGALAGIFLAYELFDATNALNWLGKTGLYGTILIRILVVCLGIAIIFFFIKSFKDNFSKASLLSKLGYIGGVISVFLGLIVFPVYLLNTGELVDLPHPPRTEKIIYHQPENQGYPQRQKQLYPYQDSFSQRAGKAGHERRNSQRSLLATPYLPGGHRQLA